MRAALAATLAATCLAACSETEPSQPEPEALCPGLNADSNVRREPAFIALDTGGRLTRFEVPSGQTRAMRPLGQPHRDAASPEQGIGRFLAPAPGAGGLLALDKGASHGRDAVLVLEAEGLRTRCRFALPRRNDYRAVASAGESVIAFGNRDAGGERSASLYSIMAPGTEEWETQVVRRPNRDWFVQGAAVGQDGEQAVVSYHGSDTTGADLVDLEASGRTKPTFIGEVHGAVEATRDGFVAATGADLIDLDDPAEPLGAQAESVHLMQFAVDGRGGAYVASCGDEPEVRRLGLATGSLRRTGTDGFCGEVLAASGGRYLALGSTPVDRDGFPATTSYRLRLIDLEEGGAGTPLGNGVVQAVLADPGSGG